MPHAPTPWVGLAALLAMFALPFLPAWLFDGPRTVRHWPRRHVCAACDAPWTGDHTCTSAEREAVTPLRGELRRPDPAFRVGEHDPAELERRPAGAAPVARRWPKAPLTASPKVR
jgi:hypothetical protein